MIDINRQKFLSSHEVQEFILWIEPLLDSDGVMCHKYVDAAASHWSCDSLHDAHHKYRWPFKLHRPDTGQLVRGVDFSYSSDVLSSLRYGLRQALARGDIEACRRYCIAVLQWGGLVSHNRSTIEDKGDQLVPFLRTVQAALDLPSYDTENPPAVKMTSGLCKIYHLIVDYLIMYDSRVGAGLALLIREFCRFVGADTVPDTLRFHLPIPRSRARRRNPSTDRYRFPVVSRADKHSNSAVKASWLLRGVLDNTNSSFDRYEGESRLTALQSAIFMLGYDIRGFSI